MVSWLPAPLCRRALFARGQRSGVRRAHPGPARDRKRVRFIDPRFLRASAVPLVSRGWHPAHGICLMESVFPDPGADSRQLQAFLAKKGLLLLPASVAVSGPCGHVSPCLILFRTALACSGVPCSGWSCLFHLPLQHTCARLGRAVWRSGLVFACHPLRPVLEGGR